MLLLLAPWLPSNERRTHIAMRENACLMGLIVSSVKKMHRAQSHKRQQDERASEQGSAGGVSSSSPLHLAVLHRRPTQEHELVDSSTFGRVYATLSDLGRPTTT